MGMAMPVLMPSAVGESITVNNGSSDLSRSFSMSSSGDTNSNIMFFTPRSKKAKVLIDSDDGMVTSLSKIESQVFRHVRHGRLSAAAAILHRLHSLHQAWLRHSPTKHR
ncbi:unnamed protein product [Triticum turgidum subsp. durum]|uniref:Uncharacterized protein n=1 Tax=Triticum turgidum subsp. durum TaxID=4567 RepID=A0A9R0RKE9_TRITD|nr:unnamed protein product [Triticum turgidum subsp. durum]